MDEDLEITWNAIQKAYEKFNDVLEDEGFDPAYWIFNLEVNLLSTDLEYILETIKYSNKEVELK